MVGSVTSRSHHLTGVVMTCAVPFVDRQWTHGVNLMQAAYIWGLEHRLAPTAGWIERGKEMIGKIYKYQHHLCQSNSHSDDPAGQPIQLVHRLLFFRVDTTDCRRVCRRVTSA